MVSNGNKMKTIKVDEENLDDLEDELAEEFHREEYKKPMPVHSSGLKNIHKDKFSADSKKLNDDENLADIKKKG
jgi:hypothetical protein